MTTTTNMNTEENARILYIKIKCDDDFLFVSVFCSSPFSYSKI